MLKFTNNLKNSFLKLTQLFLLLNLACLAEVLALDTCLSCAERKTNLCAKECALVPVERVKECQLMCISQYCEHRCHEESDKATISEVFQADCEKCKNQQFPLCDPACDFKSEFRRAACKVDCAIKRCSKECK